MYINKHYVKFQLCISTHYGDIISLVGTLILSLTVYI